MNIAYSPKLARYGTHEGASERTFIVHGDTILPPHPLYGAGVEFDGNNG